MSWLRGFSLELLASFLPTSATRANQSTGNILSFILSCPFSLNFIKAKGMACNSAWNQYKPVLLVGDKASVCSLCNSHEKKKQKIIFFV